MISIVCEAKYINFTGQPVVICDLNKEKNQSIDIDKNSTFIQAQSEIVKLTTGVVVKTKKSRTIEHSIELLEATTLESKKDYKSSIPSPISILLPDIRKEVERKLGQSFKQSETIEQEVELDGNIHRQYKLVWYDKVRRGRINFIENGKTIQIPFQFREWSELKVEDVEP